MKWNIFVSYATKESKIKFRNQPAQQQNFCNTEIIPSKAEDLAVASVC